MKRRTSALSVSATALVVAAPLLTGCGDTHQGAAAVVGDEKITVSQVQHQVESVRDAQRSEENADELIAGSGSLSRDTVSQMVIDELVELTAREQGIEVDRREVQENISAFQEQFPNEEEMLRYQIQANVATPEQLEQRIRTDLLIAKLNEEVGPEQLGQVVADVADRTGVEINPRYGSWDNETASIGEASMPWIGEGKTDEGPGGELQLPPGAEGP